MFFLNKIVLLSQFLTTFKRYFQSLGKPVAILFENDTIKPKIK